MLFSGFQDRAIGKTRAFRHIKVVQRVRWGVEKGILHSRLLTPSHRSIEGDRGADMWRAGVRVKGKERKECGLDAIHGGWQAASQDRRNHRTAKMNKGTRKKNPLGVSCEKARDVKVERRSNNVFSSS